MESLWVFNLISHKWGQKTIWDIKFNKRTCILHLQAILCYFVYYRCTLIMTFQKIFQIFLIKILQKLSKGHTKISAHFPNVYEDYKIFKDKQKLSKTYEEDLNFFQSYTNKFKHCITLISSLRRIWKIFHQVSHVVSYEFYECFFSSKTLIQHV